MTFPTSTDEFNFLQLVKQESFREEILSATVIDNNLIYCCTKHAIYLFHLSKYLTPTFTFTKQNDQNQNQSYESSQQETNSPNEIEQP